MDSANTRVVLDIGNDINQKCPGRGFSAANEGLL